MHACMQVCVWDVLCKKAAPASMAWPACRRKMGGWVPWRPGSSRGLCVCVGGGFGASAAKPACAARGGGRRVCVHRGALQQFEVRAPLCQPASKPAWRHDGFILVAQQIGFHAAGRAWNASHLIAANDGYRGAAWPHHPATTTMAGDDRHCRRQVARAPTQGRIGLPPQGAPGQKQHTRPSRLPALRHHWPGGSGTGNARLPRWLCRDRQAPSSLLQAPRRARGSHTCCQAATHGQSPNTHTCATQVQVACAATHTGSRASRVAIIALRVLQHSAAFLYHHH